MDRARVEQWLARYVEAWKSYDPQAIGDLFAENAEYLYHPWNEPVRGREAIVASWLKQPDAPGSFEAHYEPLCVEGDTAVATGKTTYFKEQTTAVERVFYNVFAMKFDEDGRCVDFREWYMQRPAG